jgi:hypothetical protein
MNKFQTAFNQDDKECNVNQIEVWASFNRLIEKARKGFRN